MPPRATLEIERFRHSEAAALQTPTAHRCSVARFFQVSSRASLTPLQKTLPLSGAHLLPQILFNSKRTSSPRLSPPGAEGWGGKGVGVGEEG